MAIPGARSVQKTGERKHWDDIVCKYDRRGPRARPSYKRISAHTVRRALMRDLRAEVSDAERPE